MTRAELRDLIVAEARRLGFHRVGVAPVGPARRYRAYREWLDRGLHGDMAYMADPAHVDARRDLRALLANARSAVVVALAYDPEPAGPGEPTGLAEQNAPDVSAASGERTAPDGPADPGESLEPGESTAPDEPTGAPARGFVARYARGDDYHGVLKVRLRALAEALRARVGAAVAARACVDSAPVLERDLAERCGLGFIGKNTMLISPGLGSYTVLGELLLDLDVAPTAATARDLAGRCGECRACLDVCPTNAFPAPYVLDARRCVSYLTIEHKGRIDPALRPGVGAMIFGCDLCQEVCPFNARAPARHPPDPALAPRSPDRGAPDLLALLALGANQRRRYVEGTALRRADRVKLRRNLCVALGNTGDARAVPALIAALDDRSPIVRGHAAWALGQLGARATGAARTTRAASPASVPPAPPAASSASTSPARGGANPSARTDVLAEAPIEVSAEAPIKVPAEAPIKELMKAPIEELIEAPIQELIEAPTECLAEAIRDALTRAHAREPDPTVRAELQAALSRPEHGRRRPRTR